MTLRWGHPFSVYWPMIPKNARPGDASSIAELHHLNLEEVTEHA